MVLRSPYADEHDAVKSSSPCDNAVNHGSIIYSQEKDWDVENLNSRSLLLSPKCKNMSNIHPRRLNFSIILIFSFQFYI